MKRVFTFLLTSLVFVMSAVVAAPTDLPQMTTDMENPVYYTISNTRSTSGRYLYYAGDEVGLKDANEITEASLFYFTGTAEACYIHNAATDKKVASVNSWTDAGIEWGIGVTPFGDGTTGLCICPKGNTQSAGYWNEFTHNDSYTTYLANDAGSVFVIEAYDESNVPDISLAPQPEMGLSYRIKLADQDRYLTINGYNGTGAIGAHGTTPFLEKSLMNNDQIWTFEATDTEGVFYLKSKSGYYITHDNWNVNAFDNPSTKGLVSFVAHDENTYKIKNVNRGSWYKVEIPTTGGNTPYPFCDADNNIAALFSLELVDLEEEFASGVILTYEFKYNGEVKFVQTETLVAGSAYPDYKVALPFGTSAVAKPEGVINETETVEVELSANLPFEYAENDNAIGEKWYYLTIHANNRNFLYYDPETNYLDATKTEVDMQNEEAYAWAFVGNPFDGFKIVNKLAGVEKSLYAGESLAYLGTTGHLFRLSESSYATEGFFMAAINGENPQRLNKYNNKVGYWIDADAGSTFLTVGRQSEGQLLANLLAQASELIAAHVDNHAENPLLGQYSSAAYAALERAVNESNVNKASLEEAINAFEESKCLPVFTIDGVYDYAAGMSIYEDEEGRLLWKETERTESMLWVFDMTDTIVGVTDRVVVKNLATGNLFWDASFIQVTETAEGDTDDELFLFYTEGVGYPVHADRMTQSIVRWYNLSANSASAWKFTYAGTTYGINDLPETPDTPDGSGAVTSLSDADPTKCYTITTTTRGGWAVDAANTIFSSTVSENLAFDADDPQQQFAILSANGIDYYLYSVGAKRFVKKDRSLVAGVADAIEFVDASMKGEGRVQVRFRGFSDGYINLGAEKQITIDNWKTIDDGNAVLIAEAGDFDAAEALAFLSGDENAILDILVAQAREFVEANAGNHAVAPAIGQYPTAAYEALVDAVDAQDVTRESLEEAIAAFKAAKCMPVFSIDGAYNYTIGMSIYEDNEIQLLWKETNREDEKMLWVFDQVDTVVSVTNKVVVKNLASGNLFWGYAYLQVKETSEGVADDGIFLIYPEAGGYPVYASQEGLLRRNYQSANSGSAWKFTYVGTTYGLSDIPDDDEPADDCTITYEFAHNGQVLYTQESIVALGDAYPDYDIEFPFGVAAVAKPEGVVGGSETIVIELSVNLPIEYAESYEEIGDNWHYLTIHATQKNYLYYDPSLDYLDVTKTGVDTTNVDAYAWAFVGNPIEGFKIVNKLAGQDKNLCLGERYAYMGEEASVFALEGSSHPSGFVIPIGRESLYLNKNNGKLGYWGYLDNGCVFFMTDEMGSITPVVPAPPKVWYDVVVYAGENGTVDGGGNFEEGTRVSVSATPNAGYRFAGWSNGSTANPYEFTVRGAVELTATFEELPHPGEMLIPFGQFTHEPWPVKYFRADMDSDVTPGANWYAPDFDDSSWITAEAPITNVRYKFYTATMWEPLRSTYWVRRTFNLESIPQDRTFVLYVSHDDECTMYLNGHQIFETRGWTETYKAVKMDDEFASYLVEGENVITAVVTNSGLNHACVDFGIYHVEKEAEVIQPKRSVMVYAGAYSRCILEDHVIEPNDSLTLSGAFEDGETIRLVFEPLEGYRVLSMKRNGEFVAIHNNVYEERAFEDVMFTDVTYEAPAPKVWYDVVVLAGENGTVDGGGNYEEGTRVSVSATPNAGYRFAGWSNGSNANPYEFTVREAVELTAEFEALPHPGEMLIPFGQFTHEPWPVKYFRADMDSNVAPDTCWYTPDFDDSSWTSAEAPITNVRYKFYTATFWEPLRSTYWVRRTFDLDSIPQDRDFVLYVSHDDECTMYLNGHKIFEATGWTETYKAVAMNDEFASYLVEGENVMTAVVTNSGLNHACVDFGIYHIEKGDEVVQPKRSVMAYAGAYGRCILNDHVIEANDSLTLSSAFEDGDTIRLVFEPLEGYNVVGMKRNGEFVAIHNNVYEELAFEDVMFTDVTYEVNVPLEIISMEPDSVPVAKVDYLTLTFNEEVTFTLPDEGIVVTGINTGAQFVITESFVRDRYDGTFRALMYFKLESGEYDVINTPDTYAYTLPTGVIQSVDGDELPDTTITFSVVGLFSLESFSPAETTCLDKIELTFDEEIAEAMTPWYELGVYNNYNGEWHFSSAVNNIFIGDDKHVVTLELETPIVEPGEYYFHIPEGLFIAEGGMRNDTASMTFVVVEDSIEAPEEGMLGDVNSDGQYTMSDVVMMVNAVLEKPQVNFNANVADMNGDGSITMSDVVSVLRLVLTDGESMAPARRVQRSAVTLPELCAMELAAVGDNRIVLPVALSNSEAYSAFQLDVVLPEGVELAEATLTDRAKSTHSVAWNTLADGSVRIVAYALDNATFRGNEGELLNLVLNTSDKLSADAEIVLTDGLFTMVDGTEHRAADVSVKMRVTSDIDETYAVSFQAYGVEEGVAIECGADTVVRIYAATGQLVKQTIIEKGKSFISLPAGTYMVNGYKVIVK